MHRVFRSPVRLELVRAVPRCLATAAVAVVATACPALAYDYPIDNPYVATVIGTPSEFRAKIPDEIPGEARTLEMPKTAALPDVFWYEHGLHFGFAPQPAEAPLIFIVAGTGSYYKSTTVVQLARAFYGAGYHVISITSPTHLNFLVNASTTHLPGFPSIDVVDLYNVMLAAYEDVRDEIVVTNVHLTGYSLGGSQAAFLAKLDEERGAFGFKRVLMINPAVDLYASAAIFDRLLDESIPGGINGVGEFLNGVVEDLAALYQDSDALRLDGNFVYQAFEQTKNRYPNADAREIEIAKALIAIAFRIASANMVFGADVMNRSGYIVPSVVTLGKYDSLTPYARASHRTRFTEYANDMVIRALLAQNPGTTRKELLANAGLRSIEDYLATADHIGVVSNQDEIILAPGELQYLQRVFGERMKTWPRGGHLGNIQYRDNIRYMLDFFDGEGS